MQSSWFGAMGHLDTKSGALCGSSLPPDPGTTTGRVQAAVVSLRRASFLKQPSAATIHRKALLCHQPKVALKEQFPGAPDCLLTQRVAAEFPVAGGDLGQWG